MRTNRERNRPLPRAVLILTGLLVTWGCQPTPVGKRPATEAVDPPSTETSHITPSTSDAGDAPKTAPAVSRAAESRASSGDSSAPGTGSPADDVPSPGPEAAREPNGPVPTATPPADARPTASTDSGEPIEIIFDDIQLPIQADMVFRPFMMTDRVRELDGKRVRINGYMLPDSKTKGIKKFVLLKNTECKFGPGGQADHLVNVLMVEGVTAKFRGDAISVEGILKVNPFTGPDGNTWSIYDLACDRVETYQPRR